jgi:hypothetical protein
VPHNFPKTHRLYQAAEEIELTGAALTRMGKVGVRPIKELEDAWADFLIHVERIWNKLLAAGRGLPGWQAIESEISKLRKTDPLLRYVHHARNAGEHTIQEFSVDWKGPIKIENLTSTSFTASVPPWDRPLLAVRDRGAIYMPPREHLGVSLQDKLGKGLPEPFLVAQIALRFYFDVFMRANREVSWPPP